MSASRSRSWVLPAVIASLCLASGARATSVDLADATIADIDAAFDKGTLTSEKLVRGEGAEIAAAWHTRHPEG